MGPVGVAGVVDLPGFCILVMCERGFEFAREIAGAGKADVGPVGADFVFGGFGEIECELGVALGQVDVVDA